VNSTARGTVLFVSLAGLVSRNPCVLLRFDAPGAALGHKGAPADVRISKARGSQCT
jgi:hypothetical protein